MRFTLGETESSPFRVASFSKSEISSDVDLEREESDNLIVCGAIVDFTGNEAALDGALENFVPDFEA